MLLDHSKLIVEASKNEKDLRSFLLPDNLNREITPYM